MKRIVNFTVTNKDTWYEVFNEADYKNNPIQEIKVKLRETSSADHFRYAYDPDTGTANTFSTYMTSTSGFAIITNVKKLFVYIPDYASEVIEIEIVYR